jgi:choline dehydrogenase-like flavoprotein
MADEYDVIIVGSGAGGGTLAHRLAPSGKRVLILERGDWLPREIENWDATAVFVDNRYVSKDTWYDQNGKPFQPQIHYFVGGATKFYGAALYRLRERDFGELQHHDGMSPAWPVGYDVFEPYYTQAEQLYQVHGARGEDSTDPWSSAPYAFPPVSNEPRIQQLYDDLAAVGLHPFHAPCGIMLDEANPAFSTCIRCATCDGFPCLVHAKSDADVIAVRPAIRHNNVTLVRNAQVRRLETNGSGRTVTSVVADVDGKEERFTGSIVVVSAGAANSAQILVASANDQHPNGLANGSDQVGRNYMFHNSRAFLAISTEKNDTKFQKTLGFNDYYFGDHEFTYPMGNVQMVGKSSAPMYRGEKPIETTLAPTFALKDVGTRCGLLVVNRGPPEPTQPGHAELRRQCRLELHAEQPGTAGAALPPGQETSQPSGNASASSDSAQHLHEERHPSRWLRPPGRHRTLRDRPSDLGPRS